MSELKVLLADDEPFILQGLKEIIDWEKEGCTIVAACSDGKEALDYVRSHPVDLIITDIRMPEMTGLEMIKTIYEEQISDAAIIVLSGYDDFSYCREAIRYSCSDYLLKPINQNELLVAIRKQVDRKVELSARRAQNEMLEGAYLLHQVQKSLGQFSGEDTISYLSRVFPAEGKRYFVLISPADISGMEELSEAELKKLHVKVAEGLQELLKGHEKYLFTELPGYLEPYELGLLYPEDDISFPRLEAIWDAANRYLDREQICYSLYVGKSVPDYSRLAYSYSSASTIRNFHEMGRGKKIYYYERDFQVRDVQEPLLSKETIDEMVDAILENNREEMIRYTDRLIYEIGPSGENDPTGSRVNINLNYMYFRLLHLAIDQDETINQEEVMRYIGDNVSKMVEGKDFGEYLKRFVLEYANYLIQLKEKKEGNEDVFSAIEHLIHDRYHENLTLKSISTDLYMNTSYLGQLFKQHFGISFKSYLLNYRMEVAENLLKDTDRKIPDIAESVGYRDTGYFIEKFIEWNGCTPSQYRREVSREG